MECKKCGSQLEENIAFCGVCGEKVERPQKEENLPKQENLLDRCAKCGGEVSKGAKFCRHCGEVRGGASEELAAVVEIGGNVGVVDEGIKPKITLSKKNKKIIAGVAAVVVLVLLATQFKGKIATGTNNNFDLIFFEKDDDEIYAKSLGKEKYILKAAYIYDVMVSKDGKKTYSLDEDDNLYLQEGAKKPEKIASDVQWATISPLGNTVAFLKDVEDYYGTGTLYVKSGTSDPEKISSENCMTDMVSISEDGKYVAYTEVDGDFSEDNIRNFLYPVGGEKIKGSKHMLVAVDNKGTTLGVSLDQNLYLTKKGKDAEKIASEVEDIVANKDFSKLLILEQSGSLYLYKGKDKEKIETNVSSIGGAKGTSQFKNNFFRQVDTKEIDITFIKNDNMYVMFDGKESEKLVRTSFSTYGMSKDYRNFVTINDGGLYIKQFSNNKLKVEEKIDSNVSMLNADLSGSHIAYIKNQDLYYLAKGKKVGVKIDTKDDVIDVKVTEDGTLYYKTRDDSLFVSKGQKTGKKIMDDVYSWEINDKALYILDKDDRLFEIKGAGKPVKVDDDITTLASPLKNNYSTSMY